MDYVSRSRATRDWLLLSARSTAILNKGFVVDGLSWCPIVSRLVCVIRERPVCVAQTSTLDTNSPPFSLSLSYSPPSFISFAPSCSRIFSRVYASRSAFRSLISFTRVLRVSPNDDSIKLSRLNVIIANSPRIKPDSKARLARRTIEKNE